MMKEYSYSGHVLDHITHSPIPNVHIRLQGDLQTITDENGFFSFNHGEESVELIFEIKGYRSLVKTVKSNVGQKGLNTIYLKQDVNRPKTKLLIWILIVIIVCAVSGIMFAVHNCSGTVKDCPYDSIGKPNDGYCMVKKNNKYGFVSADSTRLIVDTIYTQVTEFVDSVAWVKDASGWNYVYKDSVCHYDVLSTGKYVDGMRIFGFTHPRDEKDYKHNDIIASKNKSASISSDSKRFNRLRDKDNKDINDTKGSKSKENIKYGYVNENGTIIIPPIYDSVTEFCNNIATVSVKGKFGCINTKGRMVIPIEYDNVDTRFDNNGVVLLINGTKKGLYSITKNRLIVPVEYENIKTFANDYSILTKDSKCCFVDRGGKILNDKFFENACSFSEGRAAVEQGGKWGFIDAKGEIKIDCVYSSVYSFSQGVAVVQDGLFYQYINTNGECVSGNKNYSSATSLYNNIGFVGQKQSNGSEKFGMVCKYGDNVEQCMSCILDEQPSQSSIMNYGNLSYIKVKLNGAYKIVQNSTATEKKKNFRIITFLGKLKYSGFQTIECGATGLLKVMFKGKYGVASLKKERMVIEPKFNSLDINSYSNKINCDGKTIDIQDDWKF